MSSAAKREVTLGALAVLVAAGFLVHGFIQGPDPVRPTEYSKVTGVGDLGAPGLQPNPIAGLTNPDWRVDR